MAEKRIQGVVNKIILRLFDLIGRLSTLPDPERTLALLDLVLADVPKPCCEGPSYGTYVLESTWTYDHSHTEFATICLEELDVQFEKLADPSLSGTKKRELLSRLERIYEEQVPRNGSRNMVRLYRVLSERSFGLAPFGTLFRDTVDVHFILKPICEFDENGNPVPCKIRKIRKRK